MYNIESVFLIGSTHTVCEDYTRETYIKVDDKEIPVIVVSDGCGSQQDTDMGSRFISYAATIVLRELYDTDFTHDELGKAIMAEAAKMATTLETIPEVNYATLLLAYPKDGKIKVHMWGDGTVIFNGESYTIEYSGNAPYYLIYSTNEKLDACYWATPQKIVRVETGEIVDPNNLYWEFDESELDHLILTSDGIDSFQTEHGDLDKQTIVAELVAFKNRNRGFLVRRVQKMLRKFEKDNEIFFHFDDLGIAALIKENDDE